MELNRLLRVLRSRWGIVGLISLVGFASAFTLTALASDGVKTVFEAVIAIEFELEGEETVETLADEIESERGLAVFAAQDLLAQYPSASIVADTSSARLLFFARGETDEEARRIVQELVDAYLESDPSTGGNISQQLSELELQAEEIQAQIDALEPTLTPAQEDLRRQHELLDQKVTRIEDRIVALTVADAGATDEEKELNAEEREDLEVILEDLQAEKSALPPPPTLELAPAEQLRIDALKRRMDVLELDYQRLALRTMGVTGGGNVQPVTVTDLTPDPPSPFVNGAVGLLGGAGIALLALVFTTRARKEVWLAEDLPVPLLGTVPRRRSSNRPGPSWYDSTPSGRRKESIQALRTAVEGALDETASALTVVGDHVDSLDCRTLGVDLATAFASAGRMVLVVDADYTVESDLNEFNVGEPSLETVLRLPAGSQESLDERVTGILDEAIQIRPGLVVVPSGSAPTSPADALAGQQFRSFIDQATSRFDLVVIVGGVAHSPMAQLISQRVGNALVAVSPGKTTVPRVGSLVADFNMQRVRTLGAVMISGVEAPSILPDLTLRGGQDRSSTDHLEQAESPVSRLRFYPFPMEKGSATITSGSLRSLVDDLSGTGERPDDAKSPVSANDDELGAEVLAALNAYNGERAVDAVAQYVVARVEDILTAVSGQESLSDDLADVVITNAYIPLTRVRGLRTVGEWLTEELRWELGAELGDQVAAEFAGVLTGDVTVDPDRAFDSWLALEFFDRHLERTEGEPEVWHMTSESGTVQVLVYGRRLNRDRLARLNTDVVRRSIDDLQRRLRQATEADDFDRAETLEAKLRELHLFEVALGMLQVGSSEEAKLNYPWRRRDQQPEGWYPVWAEGIRPNIAPLQRLGLLARPVLTEDELTSIGSAV